MAAAVGSRSPSPNPLLFLQLPQLASSSPVLRLHHRPFLFLLFGSPSDSSSASVQCGGSGRWWRRRTALPVVTRRLILPWQPRSAPEGATEGGGRSTVGEEEEERLDGVEERVEAPGEAIPRGDESYDGGGGGGQGAAARRGGNGPAGSRSRRPLGSPESLSLGIREPVYEVRLRTALCTVTPDVFCTYIKE